MSGEAPPIARIRALGIRMPAGHRTPASAVSHNVWVGIHWLVTGRTASGRAQLLAPHNRLSLHRRACAPTPRRRAWLSREEEVKGRLSAWHVRRSRRAVGRLSERAGGPHPRDHSVLTLLGGRVVHEGGLSPPSRRRQSASAPTGCQATTPLASGAPTQPAYTTPFARTNEPIRVIRHRRRAVDTGQLRLYCRVKLRNRRQPTMTPPLLPAAAFWLPRPPPRSLPPPHGQRRRHRCCPIPPAPCWSRCPYPDHGFRHPRPGARRHPGTRWYDCRRGGRDPSARRRLRDRRRKPHRPARFRQQPYPPGAGAAAWPVLLLLDEVFPDDRVALLQPHDAGGWRQLSCRRSPRRCPG